MRVVRVFYTVLVHDPAVGSLLALLNKREDKIKSASFLIKY